MFLSPGKRKRKRSDSVLRQKPLHQQKCKKGQSDNTNNTTKKFDYTVVGNRPRTVSTTENWLNWKVQQDHLSGIYLYMHHYLVSICTCVSLVLVTLHYQASMIAMVSCNSTVWLQVFIWDPSNGQQLGKTLIGHKQWITWLAWKPLHL